MDFYRSCGKRALDIVVSIFMIVSLGPFIAIVMLISAIIQGRPVLFKQKRPGLHMKPFIIYKLRTMTAIRVNTGEIGADEERLTPFGRFTRSVSLDEIPEFWNVVKGDMSLVGPRPLLMDYLGLYTPEQARRHEVRPGITGLAQVAGRNRLSWEERFRLDGWYVDNWSMKLDLSILAQTVARVLRREGISQPGHATMDKFRGT